MQIKTLVTSCFGNQAEIFSPKHANLPLCQLKKNLSLVAGEYIVCELKNNQAVFVKKVEDEDKYFYKYTKQKLKPIAANIDELVIVFASKPAPIPNLIDSFLILAESQNITVSLVFNKIDLQLDSTTQEIFDVYKNLDYNFFAVSTKNLQGLEELKRHLCGKQTAFCGSSGVGKSSLLNALIPDAKAQIGTVGKTLGKHTTSAAKLYLSDNYNLIDLPGAQNILAENMPKNQILNSYIELKEVLHSCKFRDCAHQKDLGCAVQNAFLQGQISQIRWDNLQNFLANSY